MVLEFSQITILAIIQGLTEFLPISSSAHLILPSLVFGWTDQGLTFDVAVHFGTLLAVVSYFWLDIKRFSLAWLKNICGKKYELTSVFKELIRESITAEKS